MKKSTVFISCGQSSDREKKFGEKLVKYFQNKGFDTYFAEHIHSSKPLLQSILDALKESEYFVAWNPLRTKNGEIGSLFVQQEIAVAASLGIPSLYFYDKGVDKMTGMSGALHLNGIEISDVSSLESNLNSLTKNWDNTSKNQLFLELGNPSLNVTTQNGQLTNWWHVSCQNGSSFKHARNCMAYIEKIFDLIKNQTISTPYQCELIWAGTGIHTLTIRRASKRDFDAIVTVKGTNIWQFQTLQTSTIYVYPSLPGGKYRINYVVMGDNFPEAKLEVELKLENDSIEIIKQKQL